MTQAPTGTLVIIERGRGSWMADWKDTPDADYVRALFRCTVTPLPFSLSVSGATVRDAMARLNPKYSVMFRGE